MNPQLNLSPCPESLKLNVRKRLMKKSNFVNSSCHWKTWWFLCILLSHLNLASIGYRFIIFASFFFFVTKNYFHYLERGCVNFLQNIKSKATKWIKQLFQRGYSLLVGKSRVDKERSLEQNRNSVYFQTGQCSSTYIQVFVGVQVTHLDPTHITKTN